DGTAPSAHAEVVVIATPWDGATQTAVSVEDRLRGKVVVSMANALTKLGKEVQPLVPPRGSGAASGQAAGRRPPRARPRPPPECGPPRPPPPPPRSGAPGGSRSRATCSSARTTPRR